MFVNTAVVLAFGMGLARAAVPVLTGLSYVHPGSHIPGSGPLPAVPRADNGISPWEWHSVAGTQCMDKSETGMWIRRGDPEKLMVYLMGGGACFNALCDQLATSNPKGFDTGPSHTGIFRPNTGGDEVTNPLGDYTIVFIPYCTGDVFFGNQDNEKSFGLLGKKKHIFKGRQHVEKVMQAFSDSDYTVRNLKNFVLTGESAGGFGSLASYDFVRTTFVSDEDKKLNTHWTLNKKNGARAVMIDDSGVVLNGNHLTPCLTKYWIDLFNLRDSLPADCDGCAESLYAIHPYLKAKYSDDVMGFISTNSDSTISLFFSFGFTKVDKNGECGNALLPGKATSPFKDGIADFFREMVIGPNNYASYFFPGTVHTHSTNTEFYFTTTTFNDLDGKDVKLVDWYADLLAGKATDVEHSLLEPEMLKNMSKHAY